MPARDLSPVRELLPKVLALLAKESGSARRLKPIWDELMGEAIRKNATPVALRNGELLVEVATPRWALELQGQEEALRARVCARLGEGVVRKLIFQLTRKAP